MSDEATEVLADKVEAWSRHKFTSPSGKRAGLVALLGGGRVSQRLSDREWAAVRSAAEHLFQGTPSSSGSTSIGEQYARREDHLRATVEGIVAGRLRALADDIGLNAPHLADMLHNAAAGNDDCGTYIARHDADTYAEVTGRLENLARLYESHAHISIHGKVYRNVAGDLRDILREATP